MNTNCDLCNGKGWICSAAYYSKFVKDGTTIIEKCDECEFFLDDNEASQFASKTENVLSFKIQNGINVKIDFHLN
ncbi:hypothetical protein H2O64_14740 [Kordia sp. YSTF-M3]|uniref:Uncharacterized protein n=1 Tax=Kordia aestuariivivens TaxID=2759037 RepID=A0ABR7QC12_9FLAO|nr:hypothetical protein [Kordia aestuariivivens]MBC8755933.1 hypothetical protein [Kordia aestuariivivens]